MPVNQRVKPGTAVAVAGSGIHSPLPDIGIGGKGGTRCSSAAGGRGHRLKSCTGTGVGTVEHAHSSGTQASAASRKAVDRIALVLGQLIDVCLAQRQALRQRIAPGLRLLQTLCSRQRRQLGRLGLGAARLRQLGLQRQAPLLPAQCARQQRNGNAEQQVVHSTRPQVAYRCCSTPKMRAG